MITPRLVTTATALFFKAFIYIDDTQYFGSLFACFHVYTSDKCNSLEENFSKQNLLRRTKIVMHFWFKNYLSYIFIYCLIFPYILIYFCLKLHWVQVENKSACLIWITHTATDTRGQYRRRNVK